MGAQLCVYVCVRGCVHDSNMSLQAAAFVLCKPSGAVGSDALSGAVHRGHICLASQALEWLRTLSLRGCARRSSGAAHAVPQGLCTPFVRGCARRSSGAVHAVPQGLCTPFLGGCAWPHCFTSQKHSGAVHLARGCVRAFSGRARPQGLCTLAVSGCAPQEHWHRPLLKREVQPQRHMIARVHMHTHIHCLAHAYNA